MGGPDVDVDCYDTEWGPGYKSADGADFYPCGLIANSLFSDVYGVSSPDQAVTLKETGIAWGSDRKAFKNPAAFEYASGLACATVAGCSNASAPCADATCEATFGEGKTGCKGYTCAGGDFDGGRCDVGDCALFYYPREDNFHFLYETYPSTISPLLGAESEHFMVWMRVAATAPFRKLYGRVTTDLKKGSTLEVAVTSNFNVDSYDGKKFLVLSTARCVGGPGPRCVCGACVCV